MASLCCAAAACSSAPSQNGNPVAGTSAIFVQGVGVTNRDCRENYCQHNEDTDMIRWNGDIYLVHRTANSQILGPDSSLHIYRSTDEGKTFTQTAVILAPPGNDYLPDGGSFDGGFGDGGFESPSGRDIRDPAFYIVGNELHFKAITRLPVNSTRDSYVNSITVESHSTDGENWSDITPIAPAEWSFWRIKEENGVYYSAAYHDGDSEVVLFSSTDGVTWTQGANIYTYTPMTPLETELTFMPSGRLLALVRTDGNDMQLLGDGPLQEQVCWALPPYSSFTCDGPLNGVRLDGPVSFFHNGRLFVSARKHLGMSDLKRTALYEITGNLEGGPIGIEEWLVFPSAGDTAYAGAVQLKSGAEIFSWYSGDVTLDEPWALGMFDATNIWTGTVDFTALTDTATDAGSEGPADAGSADAGYGG